MIGQFPIIRLMRFSHPRTKRWFRLRFAPARNALAWLRWALDFKGRAAVRGYLDECERRIEAAFPASERERIGAELMCFGRTEIRVAPSSSVTD